MSTPVIIAIVVLALLGYGLVFYFMHKKRKEALAKYDHPGAYKEAPQLLREFMNDRFAPLASQMRGAAIDAFTQCAYITSLAGKAKSAAATAAKTVAWAAVGVKARYREADHAAYLVLSGDDLHYVFFEEGSVKEHLVFDQLRLLQANPGVLNKTEKVTRMGAVMGRKTHKLVLDIDGKKMDLIYYDAIERYPDSVIGYSKNTFDTMARFRLLGGYFKEKLSAKYPHLNPQHSIA